MGAGEPRAALGIKQIDAVAGDDERFEGGRVLRVKLGFLRREKKFEVSLSERAFDCVCDVAIAVAELQERGRR